MVSISTQNYLIIDQRYRVLGVLGEGNSGTTYIAERVQDNRCVALKALSLRASKDWKMLELFEREVAVLKQLQHPAIPQYCDSFVVETERDRTFYLAQSLAEGKTLADWIKSGWRCTEADVVSIAQQMLKVLAYLQSLDPPVIHRDIKPQNIIRDADGRISLVDFGAVGHTYHNTFLRGSTVVGTFGYMAPEQFRAQVYPASDLYSLGATLLFLLTRRSPAELPVAQLKIDFRRQVNISEPLAQWLERLIEPSVDKRFASASHALTLLKRRSLPQFGAWLGQNDSLRLIWLSILVSCLGFGAALHSRYRLVSIVENGRVVENALLTGTTSTAEYLLQGGSAAVDSDLAPALFAAALSQKDHLLVKQMLADGFDLTRKTRSGQTPLHLIVEANNVQALDFLIWSYPDLNADVPDAEGRTPLQQLPNSSDYDSMASRLLKIGASPYFGAGDWSKDDLTERDTFVGSAIENRWTEALQIYVDRYGQTEASDRGLCQKEQNSVYTAIIERRYDRLPALAVLECKITPEAFSKITLTRIPESSLLLLTTMVTNPHSQDSDGNMLIHRASMASSVSLIKAALGQQSNPSIKNAEGDRPLDLLLFHQGDEYVESALILISAGASVSRTELRRFPYQLALTLKSRYGEDIFAKGINHRAR